MTERLPLFGKATAVIVWIGALRAPSHSQETKWGKLNKSFIMSRELACDALDGSMLGSVLRGDRVV